MMKSKRLLTRLILKIASKLQFKCYCIATLNIIFFFKLELLKFSVWTQKKLRRAIVSKLNLSKRYLHEFSTWRSASYVTPEKDNIAEEATHPNNPLLLVKDSSDFDWEVL